MSLFFIMLIGYVLPIGIGIYLTIVREKKGIGKYMYSNDADEYMIGSIIPILNLIVICNILLQLNNHKNKDIKNKLKGYNEIKECKSCGLYSRKGYIKLHKLNSGQGECPNCESDSYMHSSGLNIETDLPLSPKFTVKKVKELEKLIQDKEKNKLVDSQLEKYLVLQQKKLNKSYDEAVERLEKLK